MARTYQEMTKDELLREQESLLARYKDFQAKGLQLDMSRGKPCKEQLDLSVGMNDVKDYVPTDVQTLRKNLMSHDCDENGQIQIICEGIRKL